MALGRKKGGGRKEPLFGLPAALSELRLSPQDRIPDADSRPKKSSTKRVVDASGRTSFAQSNLNRQNQSPANAFAKLPARQPISGAEWWQDRGNADDMGLTSR